MRGKGDPPGLIVGGLKATLIALDLIRLPDAHIVHDGGG
jgi:hypothetical protein